MRKLGKKLVAVAGVIAMFMIILVYGFAETGIQGYRALYIWRCGVCAQQQSVMAPTHSLPSEIVEIGEHYDGV